MATGSINNKSKQVNVRVPHEVLQEIESVKDDSESTAAFFVNAAIGEIKRRQRKKAKESPEG
ncbi:YlcI/YnfO family protein [Serratia marcescens]|uniref:YlcI/YnfO family protein n=1 Tax=Serratia TaxID=613 RepID=UPI0037D21901